MTLYRNWIINDLARAGEHTNERTYVLTYIRTGQTLYPLHNFVVRRDNNQTSVSDADREIPSLGSTDNAGNSMNLVSSIIVYAHGRRLCRNWVRHGSKTISYPQCSLTFMRERYLHRSFAYAKSAVGIDVVSVH